jgi:hypothetical protein
VRKGSATNAKKKPLAEHGPGADVYRLEFEDENVGGVGALEAPDAGRAATGGARRQPRVASVAQQNMLARRARAASLDDAQLANVILWAAQQPAKQFDSLPHATEYLGRLLAALPGQLVDPVKDAIETVAQQRATAPGVTPTAASDLPTEPTSASGVAPLAPVAVSPNGRHPHARAA